MRLIDADTLKASYIVTSTTTNSLCHMYVSIEDINNAPTVDAVEVVRCRKCKYYSADDPDDLTCGYCDYWYDYHYANDFCNYGEKK